MLEGLRIAGEHCQGIGKPLVELTHRFGGDRCASGKIQSVPAQIHDHLGCCHSHRNDELP